jgi:lysophospholipase L1-like esterase
MKNGAFIVVLCAALMCGLVQAATVITPDNTKIQYTGRMDMRDPAAPVMAWPGAQILVNFQGTSIKATFTNQGDGDGSTFWAATVDDGAPIILEFPAGTSTVPIATGLADTTHTLLLHRRSEWYDGTDTFLGLELDDGKTLPSSPARPDLKIEFYGDSITVGLGLDWTESVDNRANEYTNNYMAYGSQTARNLNAQVHTQAVSGIGFVGGWGQMSNIWNLTIPGDPHSTWDFKKWVPDVIVQNLGQNDQWESTPSAAAAIQGYVDYVLRYRSVYGPDVHIVLAIGSMAATKTGSPWPGYLQSAIDMLQKNYGDDKVTKCIFSFDGLKKHPDRAAHIVMADQLTAHIQSLLAADGNGLKWVNANISGCQV